MIYTPFSPRHKTPYGAVPSGTAVTFTLRPARSEGFSSGLLLARLEQDGDRLLRIPMPQVLGTAVADVGGIATPLGLIALGASFSFRRAFAVGTPSIVASAIKLAGLELVFLPMALAAGYTGQKLVAVMMMLGLPSTVSGYVMARNMGYEGAVNSSVVMLTTLLSSVTITFWLWLLKSQGLV